MRRDRVSFEEMVAFSDREGEEPEMAEADQVRMEAAYMAEMAAEMDAELEAQMMAKGADDAANARAFLTAYVQIRGVDPDASHETILDRVAAARESTGERIANIVADGPQIRRGGMSRDK